MNTQLHQRIHINRKEVNSIEFDVQELTIPLDPGEETSFDINVINYGTPTHVHLAATGEIRDKITFLSHNPYVRYEENIPVIARIPRGEKRTYSGEIVVTAGYGAKKSGFMVKLGIVPEEAPPVEVDERLGRRRVTLVKRGGVPFEAPLIEHPLTLPVTLLLALFILLLTLKLTPDQAIWGAVSFSILIVFAVLYSMTKLIKSIR
jgi:hypothetical protein